MFSRGDFNIRIGNLNSLKGLHLLESSVALHKRRSMDSEVTARGDAGDEFMTMNERSPEDFAANYTLIGFQCMSVKDLVACNIGSIDLIFDFKVLQLPRTFDHLPIRVVYFVFHTDGNKGK